jgi:large subunit ribosomal protein L32
MPAVPKKKTSHAKQGKRRRHLVLKPLPLVPCPQCHRLKLDHHACHHRRLVAADGRADERGCGTYNGREVLDVDAKDRKRQERARREQQGR